jgi:hypothetical protein
MQEVARKWKWSKWWRVWIANFKIQCKLGSIGWTYRRNHNGGGRRNPNGRGKGVNNTIIIDIRRRIQRKHIKNVVVQTTMSLSNCDNKKNAGHHRMSVITSRHPSEDCEKNYKYPIFCKNFESFANNKQHMPFLIIRS